MRHRSPLGGGLFIIECVRFSFLTGVLSILRYNAGAAFPWHIYAVPNALFLLAALFLWLDAPKYAVYTLLYISGKSLSIFSEIASGIVFLRRINPVNFNAQTMTNPVIVLSFAFAVDIITLIIALLINIKNNKKPKPAISGAGQNNQISEPEKEDTGS